MSSAGGEDCLSGVSVGVAQVLTKGEDVSAQHQDGKRSVVGVFDGHGGVQVEMSPSHAMSKCTIARPWMVHRTHAQRRRRQTKPLKLHCSHRRRKPAWRSSCHS